MGSKAGNDRTMDTGDAGHREGPTYMHIRDIRKLTGLSENGFRFYEEKGIIKPFRNEANGYRVMTLSDGLRLLDAYDLTRFGLSIKQADKVLSGSVEEGIAALKQRSDDISQELQVTLARKEHLDRLIRELRKYAADPYLCEITESTSLVFLPVHYQDMSLNDDAYGDGPKWWTIAPLVDSGLLVTVGCDNGGIDGAHGPITSERFANQWHLPLEHALHFCRQGDKVLHFYTKYPAGGLPDPNNYAHAFVFLASHDLKMSGDKVLHRMLRHVVENGDAVRVDEAFMPVQSIHDTDE